MKNLLVHLRKSIKLIALLVIAFLLIFIIMYILFKPMYAVKLNGEIIGYTDTKKQLQEEIDDYMKSGDGESIAFVEVDTLPEYEICYSKKDIKTNEEEVVDTVIATGTPYYKNYAILVSGEEKLYVQTYEEAEKVIADLKAKNSTNVDSVTYVAKYSSDKLENTAVDVAVNSLYVAPAPVVTPAPTTKTTKTTSTGTVNTSQKVSFANASLGIPLTRPVSGTITSRFGRRSRGMHTGLDIATSAGTPIKAAAAGTVTYAGRKGSYGNLVDVNHVNGVQTYYAHGLDGSICVSAGQSVSQGQQIMKVGSTGNSTGPHLHLEVRVNGICHNPQNYLY